MARLLSEPFYERVRDSVQFTEKATVTRLPLGKKRGGGTGGRPMLMCKAKLDMEPGSFTNDVDLWEAQKDANPIASLDSQGAQIVLNDVHFDWITGGEQISEGKQILIERIDGILTVVGAECEDPIPEPPAQGGD